MSLQLAVQNSKPQIIKLLLKSGGDINQRDRNGATLLHLVISKTNQSVYGRVNTDTQEIIQQLIERGASINVEDKDGNTPLQLISKNYIGDPKDKKLSSENQAIADILKKNGAKE
ncbi:ankyrin repeat domain-containing protein [Aliinostoc sp. HNIBRCY26]|uniref:ankyrin repeat domain-containing protein n=1 Tax=Aliinostoc sp. HNIBRCY26 TaxID=3418997 RepID=UPI003D00261A